MASAQRSGRLMEISVTLRGRADEPVTFSFGSGPQLNPAVQAALQQVNATTEQTMQQLLQRRQHRQIQQSQQNQQTQTHQLDRTLHQAIADLQSSHVHHTHHLRQQPLPHQTQVDHQQSEWSSSDSQTAPTGSPAAAVTQPTRLEAFLGTLTLPTGEGQHSQAFGDGLASALSAPAAAVLGGSADPAGLPHLHRLGAIAGSIFQDLISGAIRLGDQGPPPASEQAIAKLVRGVRPSCGLQCPVCLMDFDERVNEATQMPCGHCFHEECLLQWLRSHNTCPVCRFAVEQDSTPRVTPLVTIQGVRDTQTSLEHAGAPSSSMPAIGMELQGGQMRVFHAELRPPTSTSVGSSREHQMPEALLSREALLMAATHASAEAPAPETDAQLQRLSVQELKRRLTALGVDFSQAIEKQELLALLRRHTPPVSAPPVQPPRLHVQVNMDMMHLPHFSESAATQAHQSHVDGSTSSHRASAAAVDGPTRSNATSSHGAAAAFAAAAAAAASGISTTSSTTTTQAADMPLQVADAIDGADVAGDIPIANRRPRRARSTLSSTGSELGEPPAAAPAVPLRRSSRLALTEDDPETVAETIAETGMPPSKRQRSAR